MLDLRNTARKLVGTTKGIVKQLTSNQTLNPTPPKFEEVTEVAPSPVAVANATPAYGDDINFRELLANKFLKGSGVEIGALHRPLKVPAHAKVFYVDRMNVEDLRKQYTDLADEALVDPDIVDNGETLETVDDNTQDFLISSHLIEHCQDPIMAFGNWLRVLKPGGVMYLAIPDKRFTFDIDRELTTVDHLLRDHNEGPAWSKYQHYHEWITRVHKITNNPEPHVDGMIATDYSIHFHVWTQAEMFELLNLLKREFKYDFDVRACLKNNEEMIFILEKNPLGAIQN